ncbi:MAG: YceI family protein [Flavobacteriales bacterium]|nr:YceI family protein [Flavobacteriales bacterium]MBP9079388.1 YceI family protein [Flavobacteriales bacterium]
MPRSILLAGLGLLPALLAAQTHFATRSGEVSFFSSTPMEDITAVNRKVTSVFDPSTGAVEFAALIKAFEFEKALMQEHFNENYMESATFPKATFKGMLKAAAGDDLATVGTHIVTVAGDLTIHGVTRPVSVQGTIVTSAAGTMKATSAFEVKPEDHGIKVPGVVRDKIAKSVQVKVRLEYAKL